MLDTASARRRLERWLTDTCTITGPDERDYDPATHRYTTTAGDPVYTGACRLTRSGTSDRVVLAGEGPVSLRLFDLTLPWDTTGLAVNQIVTITSSDDPQLDGRTYRVVDIQGNSETAYRRVVVEDTLTQAHPEVGS